MAVQDDNTILKKADLKAYHQQIAGQLGGTFALRTNNGDYLSTDEKVVGVYIDGKPIYQRSFKVMASSVPFTSNARTWLTIVANATQDRDVAWIDEGQSYIYWGASDNAVKPINCTHQVSSNDYWYFQPSYNAINALSQGSGGLYSIRNVASAYYFITVKYTKTTDQPNSAITSGAYDINFPNTWKENTEIYLGNGVYGYRATGTISGYNKEGRIDVQLGSSGRPQLVNTGGEISINAGTDDNTIQWNGGYYWSNTDYITCSAVGISSGILRFQLTDPNSRPHRVDAWVTYLKGGN